jgi:hypothetical protein
MVLMTKLNIPPDALSFPDARVVDARDALRSRGMLDPGRERPCTSVPQQSAAWLRNQPGGLPPLLEATT